jgi:hypothetical protein
MEISRNLWKSEINLAMIFNICPYPEGCVENQFAPFRAGAIKLILLEYSLKNSF